MNILLGTASSKTYRPLQRISGANKSEYCQRWGITYTEVVIGEPVNCWDRPMIWLDLLNRCDWLLWMGCDTLITNQTIDIRNLIRETDLVVAADGNGLQSDVFLMRNCKATRDFLERVLRHQNYGTANEQDALSIELSGARNYAEFCDQCGKFYQGGHPATQEMLDTLNDNLNRSDVRVNVVAQKVLNAYPIAQYGGTGEEEHSWKPGDFILHMPGKTLEERLDLFPKIPIVKALT